MIIEDEPVTIAVTGGLTTVDAHDAYLLELYPWRVSIQRAGDPRYVVYRSNRKQLTLHRLIMNEPRGLMVDHINGDTFDNRRGNLRIVDRFGNARNRRPNKEKACPFKGVGTTKFGKWIAQIKVHGRSIYLGCFSEIEDAARAYDSAALSYFGEHAYQNFPQRGA